jgi:hypothetical protein
LNSTRMFLHIGWPPVSKSCLVPSSPARAALVPVESPKSLLAGPPS